MQNTEPKIIFPFTLKASSELRVEGSLKGVGEGRTPAEGTGVKQLSPMQPSAEKLLIFPYWGLTNTSSVTNVRMLLKIRI